MVEKRVKLRNNELKGVYDKVYVRYGGIPSFTVAN